VARSPIARLLTVAVVVLVACDAMTEARGCGLIPLDPSVAASVGPSPGAPVSSEEREHWAREAIAARVGLSLADVVIGERATQAGPSGITVYTFKLYGRDGRYLGPAIIDESGQPLSENALQLARTVVEIRERGKVDTGLSDAVARALPWQAVPVMFQLDAPPFDGPPKPWPQDLDGDAWNAFVERHADVLYRPVVTPFIEHLRSVGAHDIAPDLASGSHVKDASVFARVPSDQVCDVARRSDVLRATHNPPIFLN
jgi:hypothetical protein